jgi:hypothetical protein
VQTEVVNSRPRVTDIGLRPWLGGVVASAVQVEVVVARRSEPDE